MTATRYELFDPLLPEPSAAEMIRLCEQFKSYGTYSEESIEDDFGEGLTQRYDAASHFVQTGGRFGRREPAEVLAARTNYFRETYAYGDDVRLPGIEPFQRHEEFLEAARKITDRSVVRPAIVYANLLVPGQELAVHTDVPEFRGMSRTRDPQWLLVAMHHSGLFDRWRIPIVTAATYFHDCKGGEFVFYPDGRDAAPQTLPAKHNTGVILDTDSTFHGVDRVAETSGPIPALRPGMRLAYEGEDTWRVGFGDEALARYRWGEIRFSVSWKAYCYTDDAEQRLVEDHRDDLTRGFALDCLIRDLRERGRLPDEVPSERDLALLIIDEYIKFPPPCPREEGSLPA